MELPVVCSQSEGVYGSWEVLSMMSALALAALSSGMTVGKNNDDVA